MVANRLAWKFVDLDDMVITRTGRTIKQIFEAEGEQGFRAREREAFETLRKSKGLVIALGGGAPVDPDIRTLAKRIGRVIWLVAPASVLWSRICSDPHSAERRPSLTGAGGLAEVEKFLTEREPHYRAMSNHIVQTMPDSPEKVAEAIEIWVRADDAD
jgi:shikimate kinase